MNEGIAGKLAKQFINSKITPLLMVAALLVGVMATFMTPREEEPQIVVPMVDLYIPYPGATPAEVEARVAKPVERTLTEIPGVDYVYSTSMPDVALVTVRYKVGEDAEKSMVKLWATLMKNMDKMPPGVQFPLMKKVSIDDVPVLNLTFWSKTNDAFQLRQTAALVADELKKTANIGDVELKGGLKRQVRILLDKQKLRQFNVSPLQIARQIQMTNSQMTSGDFRQTDQDIVVRTGKFLETASDVANIVVGLYGASPVYLRDVATVTDGPEEVNSYNFFGFAAAAPKGSPTGEYPAVTLTVAKRKGGDASVLADKVMARVAALRQTVIPASITVSETRNYGATASEKVFTLLEHLLMAVVAVTIVVGFFLGWRGALVVLASVPITFALTLLIYYLLDYSLNRVTLFALIFVTGIVVDDSIIIAENIHRHFAMKRQPKLQAAITAINEVGNPTILATFTVIAAVLPMVFVSGLMGPYMSPMPIGASLAMIFSLLVALIATPWLSFRLLKTGGHQEEYDITKTGYYKLFNAILSPFIESRLKRWIAFGVVGLMLVGAIALVPMKAVQMKMLPFDNKNEFQVIIDMPEGTPLEQTAKVAKEVANWLKTVPEVSSYEYYVGTNAPINFNGQVRHYYLRQKANMADIQVNLVPKDERSLQSHDIAKKVRASVQQIARRYNGNAKIVEIPPGPPVLSTLVAEIYGPSQPEQIALARQVKQVFEKTPGVVDVDWLVEDDQKVYNLVVNKERAAFRGVTPEQIAQTLRISIAGMDVGLLHTDKELDPVTIQVRLPRADRTSLQDLSGIFVQSQGMGALTTRLRAGEMIPLSELVSIEEKIEAKSIYRKDLRRVVYVTADVAGATESPVYAMLDMDKQIQKLKLPGGYSVSPLYTSSPASDDKPAMKWDGEWQITFEVFRDLGTAFAVVLVIIYLLIIGWFQSFKTPLIMMIAIPLSLVGIIPGHLLHGAFFTATSMIGMIALAGIMVRNSVLLIDFIQIRRAEGVDLKQAVIESAAVRTRPILLTSGAVVIGSIVMLFDPIFQGLAISLIWGGVLSTMLTLVVVPLVYYIAEKKSS